MVSITEAWIRSWDCSELNLPGYQFVSNHRSVRAGGGVSMYSDQDLSIKILREHKSHDTSVFKSLFVEICLNNESKLTFLEKFDEPLSKLTRNEKICYICGDFN